MNWDLMVHSMFKINLWIIGPSVARIIELQEETTVVDIDITLESALLNIMSEAQNKRENR